MPRGVIGKRARGSRAVGRPRSCRLKDIGAWSIKRLSPCQQQAVKEACASGTALRVGTLCSGTDSPIVVMKNLEKTLGLKVDHTFSCEFDTKKQQWITDNFPDLKLLFKDVKEVGKSEDGMALNVISGEREKVPEVDLVIAGFVCKSVSSENNDRHKYKSCIDKGIGSTGETFSGVEAYVKRYSPKVVICENVAGLAKRNKGKEPQIHSVMRSFKAAKYAANWKILESSEYHLPQRRNRCWIWAFRGLEHQAEVEEPMLSTLEALKGGKPFKFNAVKDKTAEKRGINARQKGVVREVMRLHRKRGGLPSDDLFVDVGKSNLFCVNSVDTTTCMVPNSKVYRVKEKRVLGAREHLAVQGIFPWDYPAMKKYLREKKHTLLRDMAGNAFTSTVCMAVTLACFAHGPLLRRRTAKRALE